MENRAVGECLHYKGDGDSCSRHILLVGVEEDCKHFLELPERTVSYKIRIKMKDEELSELLVYEQVIIKNIQINDSYSSHNHGTYMKMWKSALLPTKFFDDKQKAIEATLSELKKEVKNE